MAKNTKPDSKATCGLCGERRTQIKYLIDARMKQRFFDEKWLANRWGCTLSNIRALRYNGEGPKFTVIGKGLIRYGLPDVRAYERSRGFQSRSDFETRIARKTPAKAKAA